MSDKVNDLSDSDDWTLDEIRVKNNLEKILKDRYEEDYENPEFQPMERSYGGEIIKFEVMPKNSNPKLIVVAKTIKPTEIHLGFKCDMTKGFQNEKYLISNNKIYDKIAREYDKRHPSSPQLLMFPELFDFDHRDFFFMLDLKKDGYYNLDLLQEMDESHAISVVPKLAKFHAYNKLAIFSGNCEYTEVHNFIMQNEIERNEMDNFEDLWKHFCSMIFNERGLQQLHSQIRPYKQFVENLAEIRHEFWDYSDDLDDDDEPWLTIVHGNLCGNNLMFAPNGQYHDVRFLDMVFSRIGNIAEELMFFIGYNFNYDLAKQTPFINTWLAQYVFLFQTVLHNSNFIVEASCTYNNLWRECKKESKKALFHCLTELLVFYGKVHDIDKDRHIPDEACVTRAKEIIHLFIHLGWISLPQSG